MSSRTRGRRCNGEGSIILRKDGRWQGQIALGTDEGGRPIRRTVYGKTKTEVRNMLMEIRRCYVEDDFTDNGSGTLSELIDKWLRVKRSTVKPKSYDSIEEVMRNCVKPEIGFIQMQNLRAEHIQNLLDSMLDRGLSYSRTKKVYDNLNNCFVWALEQKPKLISRNPRVGVHMPLKSNFNNSSYYGFEENDEENGCKFFTEQELQKIFKAALERYPNGTPVFRLGWAYVLLANTGMRAGELCALTWDDVDLEKHTINIYKNVVYATDRRTGKKTAIVQRTPKTNSSNRKLYITKDAEKALIELKKLSKDNKFVICADTGSLWTCNSLDHTFRRILDRAGLRETKNYGVHSLRHSFATIMLMRNVDIKIVSAILGHSGTAVTQNVYQHVIREVKQATMNEFPSLIE